jgi:HD superfamily phosphohydrolase
MVIWDALQTRPFQRLRRIKQLGFSDFVYPGACHSRFSHSLGVFHTARQLIEVIRQKGPTPFDDHQAEVAMAAALVHDVGHGPFSHAFEDVGKKLKLKMAHHEPVSEALIRDGELAAALKARGRGFPDDVADVIGASGPRSIYDAVVSSQFDADRLDYMRRDRIMAGSMHGAIDYEWLLANLDVGEVKLGVDEIEGRPIDTLIVGPKGIAAAETYILGLFQLYPAIYLHKTTRGIEKVFSQLVTNVFKAVLDNNWKKSGLPKSHPLIVFPKHSEEISSALALDDSVITGALPLLARSEVPEISEPAQRLLNRNLLKCFDVRASIKRGLPDGLSAEEVENITDHASVKFIERFEIWHKGKEDQVLYDEDARSPYKPFDESKGQLIQINVRVGSGRILDLKDVSPVVAAIRPYRFLRCYFDRDNKIYSDDISSIVKEAISHVGHK